MNELQEIGKRNDTDKHTNTCFKKTYLDVYEKYFTECRQSVSNVLELGVAGGRSLRTWRDWFPNARIFGIDTSPVCEQTNGDRVSVTIGSQDDPIILQSVLNKAGGFFDIVIDDGSHINQLTIATFNFIFPFISKGGFYVLEDAGLTYEPDIKQHIEGGGWTGMQYLKDRPDICLINERSDIDKIFNNIIKGIDGETGEVEFIHFWSKLAILKKL